MKMPDARSRNPADLVKYYTDLILDERRKLEEALAAIAEYAEQLRRVTEDAGRRLIARE
jgi:hypothetical protein